jgi:hypothetical protein
MNRCLLEAVAEGELCEVKDYLVENPGRITEANETVIWLLREGGTSIGCKLSTVQKMGR